MEVRSEVNKLEGLIEPASAIVTFFKDDIKYVAAGDWQGLMAEEGGYLREWHPPTFLGVKNAVFNGPIGQAAVALAAGWGISAVGKHLSSGKVSRMGGILTDAGTGVFYGGVADMLVRPTKYNPHSQGAGVAPIGDPVMRKTGYYEATGKPTQKSAVYFR